MEIKHHVYLLISGVSWGQDWGNRDRKRDIDGVLASSWTLTSHRQHTVIAKIILNTVSLVIVTMKLGMHATEQATKSLHSRSAGPFLHTPASLSTSVTRGDWPGSVKVVHIWLYSLQLRKDRERLLKLPLKGNRKEQKKTKKKEINKEKK